MMMGSLAVHEAQRPVWSHHWAPDHMRQLLNNRERGGAHEEVQVHKAADHAVADAAVGQCNIHAIAIHHQNPMGFAAYAAQLCHISAAGSLIHCCVCGCQEGSILFKTHALGQDRRYS